MRVEHFVVGSFEYNLAQAILAVKREDKTKTNTKTKLLSAEEKAARAKKTKERQERIRLENLEQAEVINRHRQALKDKGIAVACDPVPVKPLSARRRKYFINTDQYDRLPSGVKRQAVQARATPEWADTEKIDEIYSERDKLNQNEKHDPYEVDHIYPILGKTVCGLHVEANLRLLRKSENKAKSNKHPDNP